MSVIITKGIIEKFNSMKDNTIKIVIHLNEMPSNEIGEISSLLGCFCEMAINKDGINKDDLAKIKNGHLHIEDSPSMSPSQRLRAIFYRAWEIDNKGIEDVEDYYQMRMGKLCEWIKSKELGD